MKADKIKPTIVLGAICIIVAVLLSSINMITGPIVEKRRLEEANKALLVVMPDGEGFEELDLSKFSGLPSVVTKIYKETTGKGFVFQMSVAGYKPGLVIMCGIDAAGTIVGSKYIESQETYGLEGLLDNAYNGKSIADAELIIAAGASPKSATSKAYYDAIEAALQANVIVSGGKLDDSVTLKNLIPTVAPDYADLEELQASGNVKKAYKSTNGAGYAHIITKGEASYLVIVNANGEGKVYDIDGNEVTAANADLIDEAKAHIEISKLADLLAVLPGGEGLEEVDISALALPAEVTNVYKETSGKGYVFRLVVEGYKPGMVIVCGIDSEGKIAGSKCLATQDTFGKESELDNSYNGQTISDFTPNMISGATMTSNAYKNAINIALQANVIVSGGKLDDSIVLESMIPEIAPGFNNISSVTANGNIKKAFKAKNDTGFAYIMTEGDSSYLAVVNAMGVCKIYDVEGADVTADHAALADEAKAHASANQKDYSADLIKKIEKMMAGSTDITAISLDTFNTVVSAVSFTVEGETYYGFYSRSIGFHQMDVYVVIDANGAIAKIDAKQFIFEEEYFMAFGGMNVSEYKNGFVGITGDTWTGDEAIIATATMTSNAMKESTTDAFASFDSIQKGGVQ